MNLSPEKKIAGVLTPLFALRREDDLGIGERNAAHEMYDRMPAAVRAHGLSSLPAK